ncbi:MAG TPA: GTPase, partial [Mycobacteriales bacterium]
MRALRRRAAATKPDEVPYETLVAEVGARLDALDQVISAAEGRVDPTRLDAARELGARAGERMRLSGQHTVVALAGATGSGKSSLFNAVTGLELSAVGFRRPTTGTAHACIWGPEGAGELLDWLGIPRRHQVVRESVLDGDEQAALRGLVLLDLPDFDSVERGHRLEVDRLLGLVDQVVWVVDPQKYGDRILHNAYLRQFRAHGDITIVVLNQADRLSAPDTELVVTDLKRLLDEDGLAGVPVLATSAKQPGMLIELRAALEKTVAERQAALLRLAGDLDMVSEQL